VYDCTSAALQDRYSAADYANHDREGSDGSYSYSIDPYADEYYVIIAQRGTDSTEPPPPLAPPTEVPPPPGSGCDPNYTPCIPAYPPDLDCTDVGYVQVIGSDPHALDRDNDGYGCE
jgi:hypothetical protein